MPGAQPSSTRTAAESARQDRLRGLMGSPVQAPLRTKHQFGTIDFSSFLSPPSAAKHTKDKLEDARRIAFMKQKDRDEESKVKREKALFQAKLKRDKQAKELEAARKRASDAALARAKSEAAADARNQRAKLDAAWDAASRAYMRERQQQEEFCDAAAGKRMRDKWNREWKAPPPPPPRNQSHTRRPNDPFASWRGSVDSAKGRGGWEDEDEDEEVVDVSAGVEVTEEERQQAAARKLKAKERDEAAKRILAHSSKTLMDALGLRLDASDGEVDKCVRHILRLLHPDYAINRCLGEGTRRKLRIEAAFKRLNGLRDE